jgi:hypothetical protein
LADFEKDGKNMLYTGIISQYDLSHKSDKLERIYLTNAMRYSVNDKAFKDIPGDVFILDCNRVLNMNLSYDFIDNYKGKKQKLIGIFSFIFLLLFTFSPVVLIPYFLFDKIGLIRTLLGIVESFCLLIIIYGAIDIAVDNSKEFKKKYNNTNKTNSIVAALTAVLLILLLLKITIFPHLAIFAFY